MIHKTEMGRMQNQEMCLALSGDAKPRLKWTPELHQMFTEAVTQLGGADKATPKTLMRAMGVQGLTLYHLKSHLQKYRLGKSPRSETCSTDKQKDVTGPDYAESQISGGQTSEEVIDGTHTGMNEGVQIAQALQLQMEVQKKLHEQIEVQRHLQLRIEAQGKYLQSVLKKAQATFADYNPSAVGIEAAKAELSQLVSMVDMENQSSFLSGLTETGGDRTMMSRHCSGESSLTSSESSGTTAKKQKKQEGRDIHGSNKTSVVLQLMETGLNDRVEGLKRRWSTISDNNCFEGQPKLKSQTHKELREFGQSEKLDLNTQHHSEMDSGRQELDLNSRGPEPFNESWILPGF